MRPFAIWLAIAIGIYGAFAGAYHMYLIGSPRRVLVIVDSSFPMQPVWTDVQADVRRLSGRRYTLYALITEKQRVHGWSSTLNLGSLKPYAPRSLLNLYAETEYPEFAEATEIHVLTNAVEALSQSPKDWIVHMF